MENTNCNNCGAVLDFSKEKCLYCDTWIIEQSVYDDSYISKSNSITANDMQADIASLINRESNSLLSWIGSNPVPVLIGVGALLLTNKR